MNTQRIKVISLKYKNAKLPFSYWDAQEIKELARLSEQLCKEHEAKETALQAALERNKKLEHRVEELNEQLRSYFH